MLLFWTTLVLGLLMVTKATFLMLQTAKAEAFTNWFLRSKQAAYIYFGAGLAWFLFIISNLTESDFGMYKHWLFIGFLVAGIAAFFKIPDFLSVRGWCVLVLLLSRWILDVAYMQEPSSRLFLVGFVYLLILVALYMAVAPYRMRDFLGWLYAKRSRIKAFSLVVGVYGLFLVLIALNY